MNSDSHLLLSSQLLAGVGHSLAGYHLFAKDPAHKVLPHVFHRVIGGKRRGGMWGGKGRGVEVWVQHKGNEQLRQQLSMKAGWCYTASRGGP